MRLPIKKTIPCHPELDSGSRKGNTCLKSAKFFDQIVLFESFEIPHQVRNDARRFHRYIPNQ
jgi:hypothetical protein